MADLTVEEAYGRREKRRYSLTARGQSRKLARLLQKVCDAVERLLQQADEADLELDATLSASLNNASQPIEALRSLWRAVSEMRPSPRSTNAESKGATCHKNVRKAVGMAASIVSFFV